MLKDAPEFPSQRQIPGYWWEGEQGDGWPEGYVDDTFVRWALPPSNWDQRALFHIERHLAAESSAASAYELLANAAEPSVKSLAALIIEDEHRHHRILSGIAKTLRAYVADVRVGLPPPHPALTPEQRGELLRATHQLQDLERSDAAALKDLRRELRDAPDDTMWPVLVQLMEADTAKHLKILRGIEKHLKRGH